VFDTEGHLERLVSETIKGRIGFDPVARAVLKFQRERCDVYRRFCRSIASGTDAYPYLPIEAFKLAAVTTFDSARADAVFQSSGTTGQTRSRHFVRSLALYRLSILSAFRRQFGDSASVIVGNLPGYVGAGRDSSLAYMVEVLISEFSPESGGVFTDDLGVLHRAAGHCRQTGERLIVFGAAFGLLSIVEREAIPLPSNSIVIETGGMKTHRREIERSKLHKQLATGFSLPRKQIASEYGMTEMLSQAYAMGTEWYRSPPWLQVRIVDPGDSTRELPDGQEGTIAVLDLANLYSASAILTEDIGVAGKGAFQVLGRSKGSELRGCNFLVTEA
jgi:hypothetical protein